MKLSSAAFGLAAVGAGLVVARMMARRGSEAFASPEPPSPEQLLGEPQAHLSARNAAQAFEQPEKPH